MPVEQLSSAVANEQQKSQEDLFQERYESLLTSVEAKDFLESVRLQKETKTPYALRKLIESGNLEAFTESGSLRVYDVSNSVSDPSTHWRTNKYGKQFVALHGTGGNEKASDESVDMAAFNTLLQSKEAAFLVCKNGSVIQFFDEKKGSGAIGRIPHKKTLPFMNAFTVAVEASARRTVNEGGAVTGVESLTEAQKKTLFVLFSQISKTLELDQSRFITSADPVKKSDGTFYIGAHVDDFSDADRHEVGMYSSQVQQAAMELLRNTEGGSLEKIASLQAVHTQVLDKQSSESLAKQEQVERRFLELVSGLEDALQFSPLDGSLITDAVFRIREHLQQDAEADLSSIQKAFERSGYAVTGVLYDHVSQEMHIMYNHAVLGNMTINIMKDSASVAYMYKDTPMVKNLESKKKAIENLSQFFEGERNAS